MVQITNKNQGVQGLAEGGAAAGDDRTGTATCQIGNRCEEGYITSKKFSIPWCNTPERHKGRWLHGKLGYNIWQLSRPINRDARISC